MTPVLTPLHPTLVAAPAAEDGGGGNMLLPETSDLVWGAVAFLIIAVVLIRYALPRFTKVLDERTRRIEEGLELAERAKGDQADAELKAARLVEDARRDAARIREDAQAEAKKIIATAREAAQGEAGKAMDAAERQIQAEKQAAQISLRTDVGLLASTLAERIVGEQLKDAELSARVIDRFLDGLEAAPAGERRAAPTAGDGAVR